VVKFYLKKISTVQCFAVEINININYKNMKAKNNMRVGELRNAASQKVIQGFGRGGKSVSCPPSYSPCQVSCLRHCSWPHEFPRLQYLYSFVNV
jgi:hypothetical protein